MVFTPSWFRAIANAVMFFILIFPRSKNYLKALLSESSPSGGGSIGTQVANFSLVMFGFGLVMLIQPFIMPLTHQIDADVYMFIGREFENYIIYTGVISLLIGVILRITGRVFNGYFDPKTTLAKT